jgi:two-component system sensor histidine kinase PilS (NtrC family)
VPHGVILREGDNLGSNLRGRIHRLMGLRVVMVTTLLVIAVYVQAVGEILPSQSALYGVIAVTYLLTAVYALALRLLPYLRPLIFGQVVGDLLIVTSLVYFMGDSRGGFLLLYPLAVLAGSALLARRESLLLALLATVMYAGLIVAVRAGWLLGAGLADVPDVPLRGLGYSVFVTGVACATVALVGSYLSQSLKTTGERLEWAAKRVEDLQELNRVIVESIQSGLIMVDETGRIVHLNDFGARILGRSAESIRGAPVSEVFGAAELSGAALGVRAAERSWSRLEITYRGPDGKPLTIGMSLSPLSPAERWTTGGVLIAFQDLTEVKSLEREVQTKEKLAAVGEMAAYLAHEIRNPLGSISGSAQMLLADAGVSAEQKRLLSIIRRESQRLSDSLNQFLLGTRPSSAAGGHTDIRPVVERAVTLLESDPEIRKRHAVRFECDTDGVVCLADPDALTQVFWNLARNGIEAMPEGGTLTIALKREGRDAVLRFRDQGCGMAEEEMRRVFEPFHSHSGMGTGLGLAIVYRIVREHHGDIVLRSVPGAGTEVEVRLPLAGGEGSQRAC